MIEKRLKGISLFSSAGIGETYLKKLALISLSQTKLVKQHADLYQSIYSDCNMICGDITDSEVFEKNNVRFLR